MDREVSAFEKKVAKKLEQFQSEVEGTVKQNIRAIKHLVERVLESFQQALVQARVQATVRSFTMPGLDWTGLAGVAYGTWLLGAACLPHPGGLPGLSSIQLNTPALRRPSPTLICSHAHQ